MVKINIAFAFAYLLGITALLLVWTDQVLLSQLNNNLLQSDDGTTTTTTQQSLLQQLHPGLLLPNRMPHPHLQPQQRLRGGGGGSNTTTTTATDVQQQQDKNNDDDDDDQQKPPEDVIDQVENQLELPLERQKALYKPPKYFEVYESTASTPYAYIFLLGGCRPEFPKYRDYLYGIFVAAWMLRVEFKSKASYTQLCYTFCN